ncbi:MAG: aminotransferase class I/II-fold pyridoxal phosphate-dependent enzyme, partial [Pirellulaceae bacterium]
NDYLGLAGSSLSEAVVRAVGQVGWGSGASPLVTGRGTWHAELERELARFEQTEAALLFPSGFAANCGTISSLAGKGDVVFSDAKNHASIIDGCRLSGARIVVYPHRDLSYLTMMLQQAASFRRRLIVTDSLFSMDGDLAPVAELADLAETYDAMLMIDEAHATGVLGARGRGVVELVGVESRSCIRVGTLSKALGSIGGFVAGTRRVVEWLTNKARPFVFSTALPDAAAAAGVRALEVVEAEPQRRDSLLAQADWLRDQLRGQGWHIGDARSQIIPIFLGEAEPTMALAARLRERGHFVPGIRPPTVPPGESLLRISLTAGHSRDMCEQLLEQLSELRRLE